MQSDVRFILAAAPRARCARPYRANPGPGCYAAVNPASMLHYARTAPICDFSRRKPVAVRTNAQPESGVARLLAPLSRTERESQDRN